MELPLFPLRVVLFPGATLPLHVFEERYRTMMQRVLADDGRFGVVAIRTGAEVGGYAEVYAMGTIATVDEVQRSAEGSMDLLVRGVERFHLDERLTDDPYPRGRVTVASEETGHDIDATFAAARNTGNRYLGVVAKIQRTEVRAPTMSGDPLIDSYRLASILDLDLGERQEILEAATVSDRMRLVADLARREAMLLDAIGPAVGRPHGAISPN